MVSGEGAQHPFHTHTGSDVWVFWPNFLPLSGHHIWVFSQAPLTFLPPHQALGSTLILRSQMNVRGVDPYKITPNSY